LWLVVASAPAQSDTAAPIRPTPLLGYRVVAEHPHDSRHFTQGLEIHRGKLVESAGGYGQSAVYIKNLRTGEVLRERRIPDLYFAEGLTVLADRILMLTWRERTGFVFDLRLRDDGRFRLLREGWGLTRLPTAGGEKLLLSDGSAVLHLLDPRSRAEIGTLAVHDGRAPVEQLTELEYARGEIYANVWHSDRVAVILPGSGAVRAWVDFAGLPRRFDKPPGWNADEHVLNGIAYDRESGHFFVTGKCWPRLFEVSIDP
jgi:glutamine cyclotransferase